MKLTDFRVSAGVRAWLLSWTAACALSGGAALAETPIETAPKPSSWAEAGYTPTLVFANLSVYNGSVGSRKRQWGNSGNVFVGLDVDLEKTAAWKGAGFHFHHTFFPFLRGAGQPASEEWPGSAGAYHAGAMLHNDLASGYLTRLSLSQSWQDGRVYLEAGRLSPRQIFMVSNCDTWISCTDPLLDTATGTLPVPYGSWGAYARFQPQGQTYWHAGAFEFNVATVLDKKTGYDWRTKDASGASLWLGVGQKQGYGQAPYPLTYEFNVFHNTALQTDPLSGETRRGNTGAIWRFRKTVWRPDGGNPAAHKPEAWEVFGLASYSAYGANPFRLNAELGVTWRGAFGRPDDALSMKVGWQRMSRNQQEYQRRERIAAGGADIAGHANSFRLEANTHLALTRTAFLELSAQYIFRPDSYYRPHIPEATPGGFVFGIQFVWNIGAELGL